jgi:hypothetical protein
MHVAAHASVSIDETRHVAADASVSIDETSLSSADMLHKHAVKQPQINVSIDETVLSSAYMLVQHAVEQRKPKTKTRCRRDDADEWVKL